MASPTSTPCGEEEMEILRSDLEKIRLRLSRGELVFVNNILNEVCNGFEVPELITQVGISREDARKLLARVHDVAAYPSGNGDERIGGGAGRQDAATLELTRPELMAIRNALFETLHELGIEEFGTRVGVSFEKGQTRLKQLDSLMKGKDGH
jgi:hypothetical protein